MEIRRKIYPGNNIRRFESYRTPFPLIENLVNYLAGEAANKPDILPLPNARCANRIDRDWPIGEIAEELQKVSERVRAGASELDGFQSFLRTGIFAGGYGPDIFPVSYRDVGFANEPKHFPGPC